MASWRFARDAWQIEAALTQAVPVRVGPREHEVRLKERRPAKPGAHYPVHRGGGDCPREVNRRPECGGRATRLAQDAGDQEILTDFCRKPLKQNPLLCWTIQSARSLAATMQVIFLEFPIVLLCWRNRQLSFRGQATFVRVVDMTEGRRFNRAVENCHDGDHRPH